MNENFNKTTGYCLDKLYEVYSEWIKKLSEVDKNILLKYQERLFVTYDSINDFFTLWFEDNSENRRKTLKLLSDILKLTR